MRIWSQALLCSYFIGVSFLLASCAISQKTKEPPSQGVKMHSLVVDGLSRNPQKKSFWLEKNNPSLVEAECLDQIENALVADGYKSDPKGELKITVSFLVEKPILGMSLLGSLTPFVHTVFLQAYEKDQLLWEIRVKGESEFEDRRSIFPHMALAGLGHFGKSTGGEKKYSLSDHDPRLEKIRRAEAKQGLLEQL